MLAVTLTVQQRAAIWTQIVMLPAVLLICN